MYNSNADFDSPLVFDEGDHTHPAAPVRPQQRIDLTDFADYFGPYSKDTWTENLLLGMKMLSLRVELSLSAASEVKMTEIR